MRLLLDTHAFLWFVTGHERLSPRARREMEKAESEIYLSAASVWEMAVKTSLGRLVLPGPIDAYLAEKLEGGIRTLPVEWRHAAAVAALPFHHRDPFDRLLVAQAMAEDLTLVSADPELKPYRVRLLW